MPRLCLIYNTAPRYREAIFRAIDAEYDCSWYFGKTKSDIKPMDVSVLKNVTMIDNMFFFKNRLYWQKGVLKSVFSVTINPSAIKVFSSRARTSASKFARFDISESLA